MDHTIHTKQPMRQVWEEVQVQVQVWRYVLRCGSGKPFSGSRHIYYRRSGLPGACRHAPPSPNPEPSLNPKLSSKPLSTPSLSLTCTRAGTSLDRRAAAAAAAASALLSLPFFFFGSGVGSGGAAGIASVTSAKWFLVACQATLVAEPWLILQGRMTVGFYQGEGTNSSFLSALLPP